MLVTAFSLARETCLPTRLVINDGAQKPESGAALQRLFVLRHSSERARATERKEMRWVPLHTYPRLTSGLEAVQDQLGLLKCFSGHLPSSAAASPKLLASTYLPLSFQSHPHNQFLKGRKHSLYVFFPVSIWYGVGEGENFGLPAQPEAEECAPPTPTSHTHKPSCRITKGSHSGRSFGKISASL